MAPVLSYINFPASQSFITEEALAKSTIEDITNVDGLISSYHGLQTTEDSNKLGILVSVWESHEKLKAFREVYGAKFNSIIADLSTGPITRYEIVAIRRVPQPALECPSVEIAVGKLKPGANLDTFREAVIGMSDTVHGMGHPCAVGEVIEGPGHLVLAGGWDNVPQQEAFASTEHAQAVLKRFISLADLHIIHVSLKKRSV